MKKKLIPILVIAAITLAACNSAGATPGEIPLADGECRQFSFISEYLVEKQPGLPPVTDEDWATGPDDAAVTLIEYSQLTCPACGGFEPFLDAIRERYPDDVRVVFRHFTFQEKSIIAAQALEAAGVQGMFNEFKDFMFERRAKDPNNPTLADLPAEAFWGALPEADFDAWLEEYAGEIGVNSTQLIEDMHSKEIVRKVQDAKASADKLALGGTPAVFINGYPWPKDLPRGFDVFSIFIQLIKNKDVEYDTCPNNVIEPNKDYFATISTSKGDIKVDLFEETAPLAVNSFVFLAEEGWYDGLPIYSTSEIILSGDPSDSSGFGGPGYAYLDELSNDNSFENPGKLATYRTGPDQNGSAFFINKSGLEEVQETTIFGEVTEGMDVVAALELRENMFDDPIDHILNIAITAQ